MSQLCPVCGEPAPEGRLTCTNHCRNILNARKRTRPVRLCEICQSPVTGRGKRTCSIACRNTLNSRTRERTKGIVCSGCGSYGYHRKFGLCQNCRQKLTPEERRVRGIDRPLHLWTSQDDDYLRAHYAEQGPDPIADHLRLDPWQVINRANRLGLKQSRAIREQRLYASTRQRMTDDNPMYDADTAKRVGQKIASDPDNLARLAEGRQRVERKNPSGLERKLRGVLDELGIEYEPSALVKPRFVVDVRIGNLIIQADGEYWHGHPRFEPLTERQQTQQKRDRAQDAYLTKCGYTIIRVWERELTLDKVKCILRQNGVAFSEPGNSQPISFMPQTPTMDAS